MIDIIFSSAAAGRFLLALLFFSWNHNHQHVYSGRRRPSFLLAEGAFFDWGWNPQTLWRKMYNLQENSDSLPYKSENCICLEWSRGSAAGTSSPSLGLCWTAAASPPPFRCAGRTSERASERASPCIERHCDMAAPSRAEMPNEVCFPIPESTRGHRMRRKSAL